MEHHLILASTVSFVLSLVYGFRCKDAEHKDADYKDADYKDAVTASLYNQQMVFPEHNFDQRNLFVQKGMAYFE